MIDFPNIDPIIFQIGPLQIRWYSLAYIIGILGGFHLFKPYFFKRLSFSQDEFVNCITYLILGIIIGGRLGYVLIYDLVYFLEYPHHIFAVWRGGMSFHGGAVGALVAMYF